MEVNQLPPQFIGRNGTPVAGIIMCVYVDARMGKRGTKGGGETETARADI